MKNDMLLVIDVTELAVWRSENGVLLTREIPLAAVMEVVEIAD